MDDLSFWVRQLPAKKGNVSPAILILWSALVLLTAGGGGPRLSVQSTPSDFTVAFVGDQGIGAGAVAVLSLIAAENTDMVIHQGDLGYTIDADAWDQMITDALGLNFPYFASVGNHDCDGSAGCDGPGLWPDYSQKLQERLDRVTGASCTGELGVNSACTYNGLFFVLSGPATMGSGHAQYIEAELAADDSLWRVCSWHRVERLMQVGGKSDEVGWDPYDKCREGGAIVATGHEHSYSRTHLMDSFETQSIASTSSTLVIGAGQSFAFVSGLGGQSIRGQDDALAANPWWTSVYTSAQGANYGALFCTFNKDGDPGSAHCYFKDIDGVVADDFHLSTVVAAASVPATNLTGLGIIFASFLVLTVLTTRRIRVNLASC